MTKLEFPTLAEKALAEFNDSKETIALAKIAKRYSADVEKSFSGGVMTYTFDDDTSIITEGRGKSWTARTELP